VTAADRLFTTRFFTMCGFTFTVFLSAFQLLPTAPFRILDLGGSTFASGLFLGFLTYASALSAPLTGALGDRVGHRRILIASSLAIAILTTWYAVLDDYRIVLTLVIVHGVFWSGLLSASAAYLTSAVPEARRAEGLAYWGLSSIGAIAIAPTVGFWIYRHGWRWLCAETVALNALMAIIAVSLKEAPQKKTAAPTGSSKGLLEWRVLIVSFTLFLYSFSYGGITSFAALYARENGTDPESLYLTLLGIVILISRPAAGRWADRLGYRRLLIPSLVFITVGLTLLAFRGTRAWTIASAVVFGLGFGTAYPVFVAHVLRDIEATRRGAAFGAILSAFDIGIGTGSIAIGWIAERVGFNRAFAVAAALSALALPYFLLVDRKTGGRAYRGAGLSGTRSRG
jgi:MFS family permease